MLNLVIYKIKKYSLWITDEVFRCELLDYLYKEKFFRKICKKVIGFLKIKEL